MKEVLEEEKFWVIKPVFRSVQKVNRYCRKRRVESREGRKRRINQFHLEFLKKKNLNLFTIL